MELIEDKAVMLGQVKAWKGKGKSVGLVPTMGALHQGHLELVRRSMRENDETICSIFVNPLQFNNPEDLEKYPNTLQQDIELLQKEGCSLVFSPTADLFYKGVKNKKFNFGILGVVMEAKFRPGHFEGVAAVISEFFKCVQPNKAYFGEKDYQQLAVIRWLVKEELFSVEVVACKTVRAESGLALSSRNLRLTSSGVEVASDVYKVLSFCRNNKHIFDPETLAENAFAKLSENFEVEYFEIVDENSFERIDDWVDTEYPRAFVVAKLEGVRLIDNLSLNN
jgi:pantoate--beta-alanine ligase